MGNNHQIYRVAAFLVGVAALLYVFERFWSLALLFQDIILLFALSWLVSFTLTPVVEWLKRPYWPPALQRRYAAPGARGLLSHGGAVAIVYLCMVLALMIGVGSILPVVIEQGQKLGTLIPELPNRLPALMTTLEDELTRIGIKVDLPGLYQANVAPSLKDLAGNAFKEFMNAFSVIAATVSNSLLVIILSLYMSFSGRELALELEALLPRRYREEARVFVASVNKNFGGFVRGQLVQALLTSLATAVIMLILRLDFFVLASVLSGILMLIPLLGVALTLIPPVVIAFFIGSLPSALIVLIVLFVFQQVLMNVIMPKIMSESVGLHPLLVFGALLVGVRVGGIWGAFFGIPVAGVLYAMLIFVTKRLRQQQSLPPATRIPAPEPPAGS
ncbi:MAG: AI-2E family transporter [Chloroflexi bacterium]|nr:AI-2E family transporter [Chloroflexota bacterium]